MVGFAGYKVLSRFRHPRWVGMRVGSRDLVAWSFLMAMAHGAGLMLVPPLLALRGDAMPMTMVHGAGQMHHMAESSGDGLAVLLLAIGLHTATMFGVAGAVALVVYRHVGSACCGGRGSTAT
jgi:hypothetical protein